ncbi:MAG: TadE/TadG family type IV pilus assembly protein [Acidimicrobiales bacterium]
MRGSREQGAQGRARGDRGAAVVEFALVSVLLLSIVFGIIHYGLILSFKQDVTRAAAEGARAGAVEFPATQTDVETAAQAALGEAVESFGGSTWSSQGCGRAGTLCKVSEGPCTNGSGRCVTVELYYDYDGDGDCGGPGKDPASPGTPLYGQIPVIGGLIAPDCVSAKSVAKTNG